MAMIEYREGNLLKAPAEALVNTVNTVGVMGKGIALQFRQAFPDNYKAYRKACAKGEVVLGRVFVFHRGTLDMPRYIINFPTKKHWRSKTRIADVKVGLQDLVKTIEELQIQSIAVPPLGCGHGGLSWDDVRPLILEALEDVPGLRVLLFAPAGAPEAEDMVVETARPNMTPGRAAIVALLENYLEPGYRATLLELQKLAYFMQEAGEPLRLNFARGPYGPYAENLNHVLQRIEGHFLRGYGDRSSNAAIRVLGGAAREARQYLWEHHSTELRLKRVQDVIHGFETPYGLELLASVHWVRSHEDPPARSLAESQDAIRAWTTRKARLFDPFHVEVAWRQLESQGWLRVKSL